VRTRLPGGAGGFGSCYMVAWKLLYVNSIFMCTYWLFEWGGLVRRMASQGAELERVGPSKLRVNLSELPSVLRASRVNRDSYGLMRRNGK